MTGLLSLMGVYVGLVVVGPLMALAERRGRQDRWIEPVPAERRLDFIYWALTPLVTGTLTRATTFGFLALIGMGFDPDSTVSDFVSHVQAYSLFVKQPLALQFVEALLVADFVGYWSHRLRHGRKLWPFHAIHHSPERLDWLAAARMEG
jgi:sterol desaturase/sphingolipid hydroxylase (fatty acid hydroxylase superfamily)